MYKILKNIIPKKSILETFEYIESASLKNPIFKNTDNYGQYVFKRLNHNQLISSEKIKNVLFHEPLIQKIKEEVGDFCFINDVRGLLNSYGSKPHRDGQSFGFSLDGIKKGSKVIKILVYYYNNSEEIPKNNGLDINLIDTNLKKFFFLNKKIYMKLNFYYEYYFRSKIYKTLELKLGDVVLMDNNTWHRATMNDSRPKDEKNFKIKKILLDYEIVTDKVFAKEYVQHVRKHFKDHEDNLNKRNILLDNISFDKFKKNGIDIVNLY